MGLKRGKNVTKNSVDSDDFGVPRRRLSKCICKRFGARPVGSATGLAACRAGGTVQSHAGRLENWHFYWNRPCMAHDRRRHFYLEISNRPWSSVFRSVIRWAHFLQAKFLKCFIESILAVELVRPLPDIFQPQIKYLLVVTTSIEIIILGICFTNDDMNELTIIPDPLFSVSTEGILFQSIKGTADGRIFLAGRDGCLHEVIYSAEKGTILFKYKLYNA